MSSESSGDFTIDMLFEDFGPGRPGEVQRLKRFAFLPNEVIERLKQIALDEEWGPGNYVLLKYIAEQVPKSIEQRRFVWFEDQLTVTAGHLQTRYGTPVYLVFEKNLRPGVQPWFLRVATERARASELPQPPDWPEWPSIDMNSEIVTAHEHILDENVGRVEFLRGTPRVAQMCAITGAIQWSLHRELHIPQVYFGVPSYFVPLYLATREDITAPPDLVAPVQVQSGYMTVRTVLLPHMAYSRARVVARRADQLPSWLTRAWAEHSASLSEEEEIAAEERELGLLSEPSTP